jgi:hypothetical protein
MKRDVSPKPTQATAPSVGRLDFVREALDIIVNRRADADVYENTLWQLGQALASSRGVDFQRGVIAEVARDSTRHAAELARVWNLSTPVAMRQQQSSVPVRRHVVDLRSSAEIEIEKRGRSPLAGLDEEVAKRLVTLLTQTSRAGDEAHRTIRDIGEQLNSQGGLKRMQELGYRVRALGGKASLLESIWDGIGEWMG